MSIDIDVNDPTPRTPCQTEGCSWPNFHVCLVGKPDLFPKLMGEKYQYAGGGVKLRRLSDTHRHRLSLAQQARHAANRLLNRERDEAIVQRYRDGESMEVIAKSLSMARMTIRDILQYAADNNEVVIRTKADQLRAMAAARSEKIRERDENMARRYAEGGLSIAGLAKEFNVDSSTARKAVRHGEAKGLCKMRPRGHTLEKGAA